MHEGMDFTANTGTPIYATGDGVVVSADNSKSGYGNHIEISHGYGYLTLYGHLSKYNCRAGQGVKRGDIIGYVGSTGRSEAPHLHFEIRDQKTEEPLNPQLFGIAVADSVPPDLNELYLFIFKTKVLRRCSPVVPLSYVLSIAYSYLSLCLSSLTLDLEPTVL